MDFADAEMSGVDAIIAIRDEFSQARIIVLTTYTGDVQVVRALKQGLRILNQNLLHKELLDAIRKVHAAKRFLPRSCLARLLATQQMILSPPQNSQFYA